MNVYMDEAKRQLRQMLRNLLTPQKDVDVNPSRESVALGTETTRPVFVDNEAIMHIMLNKLLRKI